MLAARSLGELACLLEMDFSIPPEIQAKLDELDAFIEKEIAPLEREHPPPTGSSEAEVPPRICQSGPYRT